ncbi:hypothetical protein PGT21_009899 [Puccinia graminis f. sp. tritici]|uniref:Uncharacterized protein n=1 Tax=Puccinia graminis f. sp. tritici TaxID=56615 RepID=A0A5B0R091_PUCGR|nr:hypothetical protein PGT21_009899 [Puccinia graminis f. sp. tritici]
MGQTPEQGWDWDRDDSYDHTLYDTDRPDEIIRALDLTLVLHPVCNPSQPFLSLKLVKEHTRQTTKNRKQ